MNHNILHNIIDKLAFLQWRHNINKVNQLFTKIVKYEDDYILIERNICFNCGHQPFTENNNEIVFGCYHYLLYYSLIYYQCEMCHKKKIVFSFDTKRKTVLWDQKKIDY